MHAVEARRSVLVIAVGFQAAKIRQISRKLLPFPHLRQSAFVAHHEKRRRVGTAHEVVQIKGLPNDEAGSMEGVAGLELGIFALQDLETAIAEMFDPHAAVGRPNYGYAFTYRQVVGIDGTAQYHIGRLPFAVAILTKVVPVAETHATGEDGECGIARGVVAVHIAPQPFERSYAKCLLAAFLNYTGEELEVRRSFNLARYRLLNHLAQLQYVFFVIWHNYLIVEYKNT